MSDPTPQVASGEAVEEKPTEETRAKDSHLLRDRTKHGPWARYIDAVRLGMTIGDCADYAGVAASTVRLWKQTAEKDEEDGIKSVFTEFANDVRKARAGMLSRNLATVEKARQTGDWKAASWILERHGYHRKHEVEGEMTATLTYVIDEQDLGA